MIVRMATWVMWIGGLLVLASLVVGVDRFDSDQQRELRQCRQERRVDTLNNDMPSTSLRCAELLNRDSRQQLFMFGGLALLLGAGAIRKKATKGRNKSHD